MANRLVVPLEEACQQLGGMSRSTLYNKFARGELTPVKIGRRSYLTQTELERYVNQLPMKAVAR